MTSLFSPNLQTSSSISEGSSAPPSPASSVHCARSTASLSVSNAASPSSVHNVPHYGTWVPNRVFVGGISHSTTENDLQERFNSYGPIKEIKIIRDKAGMCKGYGFITFETDEAAKLAQNETEIIMLKERRLNIAPAVIKQTVNRGYDLTHPGTLMYHHNGTSYAFDNGMAFFSSGPPQSPFSARDTTMFSSPYNHGSSHTFSPMMYSYTPQPLAYVPTGQQYSYQPIPYDAFLKSTTQTASQYVYGPPSAMNGSMNGPNQSTSPVYGLSPGPGLPGPGLPGPGLPGPGLPGPGPGHSAPPIAATAQFYHPASDLYYNGGTHVQQTPIYQMDGPQTDVYDLRERDSATPVVSLLKLQERGLEEMEITRTPRKFQGGNSGSASRLSPQYRSSYSPVNRPRASVQLPNTRNQRTRRIVSLIGQSSGPPPGDRRGGRGNNCQYRPAGGLLTGQGYEHGGYGHGGPGRPIHTQRRIYNASRSGMQHSPGAGNTDTRPSSEPRASPAPSPSSTCSPAASPCPPLDSVTILQNETGSGRNALAANRLPLSRPASPLPVMNAAGADEKDVCQQFQTLAI